MAALASRCVGFSFVARQERVFMNRFGDQIIEDVLHFDVRKDGHARPIGSRSIAQEVLKRARGRAPGESLADLDEALNLVGKVQASPIYDLETASSRSGATAGKGS